MVWCKKLRRLQKLSTWPGWCFMAAALVLVSLLFTSCSQTPSSPAVSSPKNPTTTPTVAQQQGARIVWSFWGDPWEVEINERLIKVFNSDYPNIKIDTLQTPWSEYFQKADQWLSTDNPPDVMFMDYTPVYASEGLFEDLGPYIQKDNYDIGDFYSGLLKYHTYKDKLYGLPRDNDTKVIFYNKTLFDQAGLQYPTAGWTWNDLRNAAIKLTQKNGNQTTQYGFAYEPDEWWRLWVWQNGGEVYDDDFNPTKTLIDSPQAIEAIQWLADLTNVDGVTPPYEVQKTSLGIGQLFSEGKLAMAFGNHSLLPAFASSNGLRWDVVGLPRQKNRVNASGGSGYVIPSKSKNKEAAWTFLRWLESAKGEAIFTESGVIVPARRSVGRADIFLKQDPPHNAQVFLDETEIGRPNPMYKGIQNISSLLDESLRPIWQGKTSAKDAISKAVPTINLAISQIK